MSGRCLFASDLHGREDRYLKLIAAIRAERPAAVFLGGDLLPPGAVLPGGSAFLPDWLGPRLAALRDALGSAYPRVLAIFGNDDPRCEERALGELEALGLLEHVHGRRVELLGVPVFGYACVPPTPFTLKDWERYDVSRFVDPGSVSPEEGFRSVPVPAGEVRWGTIAGDLEALTGRRRPGACRVPVPRAAARHGARPRGARRNDRRPRSARRAHRQHRDPALHRIPPAALTLHGHVHESARLTGAWQQRIGRTLCLSAAHDGPELALVRFDLGQPDGATRELV